jgi:Skp family chaperone for outer membrane proteins
MFRRQLALPAFAVLGVVALGSVGYLAGLAGARASVMAPPTSPVIATLDLEQVVQALNERKDKETALQSSLGDAKAKVDRLGEEVKNERARVENMVAGPDRDRAIKEFREKAIRAEFETQYAQKLLVEMQGEMLRDLYLKISETSARLARKNGYSLVLASDQSVQIPKGDPQDITRAIALRRMIYVDGALDITQELVTMMNNEYAAGGKR